MMEMYTFAVRMSGAASARRTVTFLHARILQSEENRRGDALPESLPDALAIRRVVMVVS